MNTIKLVVAKEIPSILFITVLICAFFFLMGNAIKKSDPYAKPKGLAFLGLWLVDVIDNYVLASMDEDSVEKMGPYIGSIAAYILLSNYAGLFGMNNPTGSWSVTLVLALISWIMIERQNLITNGIKGYIKQFFEPVFIFFLPNFIGKFSPLISMSFRLFGNILSGTIIMTIVYWGCMLASNAILGLIGISNVNFVGIAVAPILHCYFDIFSGFIQMFIFITLTMCLIQKEK